MPEQTGLVCEASSQVSQRDVLRAGLFPEFIVGAGGKVSPQNLNDFFPRPDQTT